MRRDYDIFEKFQDGQLIRRASVFGEFEAKRKMHELMELSENEFVAIEISAGDSAPAKPARSNARPLTKTGTHE
jgi:hypothetical protein